MPIVPIEACVMSQQGEICTHEKCSMFKKVCGNEQGYKDYQTRVNQSLRR